MREDTDTGKTAILKEAQEFLALCIAADDQNRDNALDDLTFVSGEQWNPQDRQQRALTGRPCLTINKLPTFLHQVTNDQRQNKAAIKVHPVDDGADVDKAKIVQGVIRHIEYASNATVATGTAVNSAATIGFGYFRLITRYCDEETFDQEIAFRRIRNAFTVYMDPAIQEPDGSDQMRCIITEKMPRAEFTRQYPDASATDTGLLQGTGDSTLNNWLGNEFVRVAEFYKVEMRPATLVQTDMGPAWEDEMPEGASVLLGRDGKPMRRKSAKRKVMWRKITACDVLEEAEIPCRWIPVFPVFGDEVDLDGKVIRSGLVRHAKDPARMYNYWMPLRLETPVATPGGWSTIGALREGDTVFSDTGAPTRVIGKSPVYINRECYRVTFGDGSSIEADAQHPWLVEQRGKRRAQGYEWTTRKLRTDELEPRRHCIRAAAPLDTPRAELPVDPYFLGVWLGDGAAAEPRITASVDDAEEMRSQIAARGLNVGAAMVYSEKAPVFTVHGVRAALTALGVRGNKHIPGEYLRASIAQRIELLRGLMDTDGSVHSATGACMFSQADEAFAEQVRELVVSLGIRVGATRRAARVHMLSNGREIRSSGLTQLAFTPPEGMRVFSMLRKVAAQTRERRRQPRRAQHKIVSVERIASVPVQCIAIDAPSHLFLAGHSMIPTHNTAATEEVALRPKTPYIGAEGQFEGHEDEWAAANVSSFPYLEYKPVTLEGALAPPPARQPMADIPLGVLQMARHASDDVKATTGLFDSSLGARGTATSGVQERAQQLQGDTANFHYADNLQITLRHCGRCIVDMLPKVYDGARVVQIMGEDEKISAQAVNGADEKAIDLTTGKYDVTIGVGPSYSTARQEATDNLIELGKNWPKLMDVAGDKVVAGMDFHGSEEVAERIKRTIPPQVLGPEDADEDQPMVQTPRGPIPAEQAGQMLVEMDAQMQEMGAALQEAQSGIAKARIDADKAVQVAQINAQAGQQKAELAYLSAQDVAELRGVIELLKVHMQPPPALAADAAVQGKANGESLQELQQ